VYGCCIELQAMRLQQYTKLQLVTVISLCVLLSQLDKTHAQVANAHKSWLSLAICNTATFILNMQMALYWGCIYLMSDCISKQETKGHNLIPTLCVAMHAVTADGFCACASVQIAQKAAERDIRVYQG